MSIKKVLSFREVFVVAFAVMLLGIVSFAFGDRYLPAMFVEIFTTDAASPAFAKPTDKPSRIPKTLSNTTARPPDKLMGMPNDGIIFGQGDLPLGYPNRVDRTYTLGQMGEPILISSLSDFEPSWSPDGKKIVFVSLRGSPGALTYNARQAQRDLYTMNADGSDQTRFTTPFYGGESQPSFSPSTVPDQKIIYVADYSPGGGESGIYITSTLTNASARLNTNNCFPPAGRVPGGKQVERSNINGAYFGFDTPNYSPDGNHIIFGYWGDDGYDVYKINPDGTGCSKLYVGTDSSFVPPNARYSRDGTRIALHHRDGWDGSHYLRIIDAITGDLIEDFQPTNFMGSPVWAPGVSNRINYIGGDQNPDGEINGLEIRSFDLATEVDDLIYSQSIHDGVRGLDWGTPTTETPPLSLRINSPNPIESGESTTGTVYLSDPAPSGGTVVLLNSLGEVGAISVPGSVTVPEGEKQATFPITSVMSSVNGRSADVWAQYNGDYALATVTLWPTRADLRANSFTTPASAAPGATILLSWEVQNIGPVITSGGDGVGSTGGYDYVYLSADDHLGPEDGDPLRTGSENAALLPDATRTAIDSPVTIQAWRAPSAGQYYLIFKTNAHPTKAVLESDYTNNILVRPITILLPDVAPENLSLPTLIEPGVSYPVSWTTRNIGTITTGTFSSRLYYSPDETLGDTNDLLLTTVSNIALVPDAVQIHNSSFKIPTVPFRSDGTAYFYVISDYFNNVYEGQPDGAGENNNKLNGSAAFEYRVPDLQVTSTGSQPEVETETAFGFEWTSANAGNKAAATFSETVYFSSDDQIGGDLPLGTFSLSGGLAAGASVDRIQNVTIPTSSIPVSGNYYVYVKTDSGLNIDEGENENNNTRFHQVYVRRLLRPDLIVTNVTGPPTVFFDQTIQVQWTVTNNGQGPTNAPQWSDTLYIGTNPITLAGATGLANTQSVSALNPGESYTASAIVKIPRGFNGAYHFLVKTDSIGNLNEENTTNNLSSNPVQVNIPPLPDMIVESVQAPDQAYANAPIDIAYTLKNQGTAASGYAGIDRIYLSRDTTLNPGVDRLIFTSDERKTTMAPGTTVTRHSAFSQRVCTDPLGETARSAGGEVNPSGTPLTCTDQDIPIHLPHDIQGLWYVFVVTDVYDGIYEFTNENNNVNYDSVLPGSPMNVIVAPPDLVVTTAPTAPANATSGESIAISFTVKNQGAFGTFVNRSPGDNWRDAIYLSTDQTFDADDRLLGSVGKDQLTQGAEYTALLSSVRLPDCLPDGTYYLIAVTDYRKEQFEFDPNFDAEANNASPPKAIQLTTLPPDLTVTNVQIPATVEPGQSISVSWTVANTGIGPASNTWSDRIILRSTNPEIAPLQIGSFDHTGGLIAGASYTETRVVGLPQYMEGDYFLSVNTDYYENVPECGTSETNNTTNSATFAVQNNLPDLVIDSITVPSTAVVGDTFNVEWNGRNANRAMPANSESWTDGVYLSTDTTPSNDDILIGNGMNALILAGGQSYAKQATVNTGNVNAGNYYVLVFADIGRRIYEGSWSSSHETNNVRASGPITLTSPAVDLQVGNVSVSLPHHSGTYRDISWTVTNTGTAQTLATQWTDYVILSRDSVLDLSDAVLGYSVRSTALAGGASYTQTSNLFIPGGLTGDYRVFVITDRNNAVVESSNINNTSPPVTINLTLPPPAELSITNITPPATISLGGNASFAWTVQNTGSNAVNGKWRDTVYLSRDQFWDASDTLVGIHDLDSQSTSVPAGGGTYSPTPTFQIPPVDEGTYYVIVRTDSQNRIRESNEGNNVSTSVATTTVTITELQLNTPFNTTLGNGSQQFFKYVTDPAETLVFSLVTDKPTRSNEVFTNFGSIVSRADYDFQSQRPGEGNQENVIAATQAGDYYSMVRTDLIPESFANNFDSSPAKSKDQKNRPQTFEPQNITLNARILPFSIRKVSPEESGNAGYTTMVIDGAKFEQGATMKLVGSGGAEIVPGKFRVTPNRIIALFDLKGKAAGVYDIVVRNPNNSTATLDNGFTIISGGGATEPRVTINGPGFARGGRLRYTVSVANDGLNDLLLVPIIITMPSRFGYELDKSNHIGDLAEFLPADAVPSQLPQHYEQDGVRVIALFTPVLGSKRTVHVNLDVMVPFAFTDYKVTAMTLPPLAEWYKMSQAEQASALNRQIAKLGSGTSAECWERTKTCFYEFLRSLLFTAISEALPSGCVGAAWGAALAVTDLTIGMIVKGDGATIFDAIGGMANLIASSLGGIAVECLEDGVPWIKLVSIALTSFKAAYDLWDCLRQYYDCLPPPPVEKYTSFPYTLDPNEMIGPRGYGAEAFVPIRQPLDYRINFENVSGATAPVQIIHVTDVLPPELDLRTVRLKEIGFKQNRIVIPDNKSFYQDRVQLGADLGDLKADILAGVDLVNNRIFWTITAVDPQTGDLPTDPFAGLLPPNNANHDGEGYLIFTVEAKPGYPNRTVIANLATIVFDQNEPIVTNTSANLLDSVVPTSQIDLLPPSSSTPEIGLSWTRSDDMDGSGFAGTSILVSEDGGPYLNFLNGSSDTAATFTGQWGKSYRFYSVGRDNAGNVELPPIMPDAAIQILGGDTEGDVSPRPNGNDGQVASDDVAQIRRFITKLDTVLAYNEFQRSDTAPRLDGGNGALSVADVIQARRYAASLDQRAEAAGPNDALPYSPKPVPGKRSSLLPREVKPVSLYRDGTKVIIGVDIEAQGDEAAIGFALNFDTAVLSSPSLIELGPDASGAVLTVNDSQAASGKLGIAIDKAPGSPFAAGTRRVLYVAFEVAPVHPDTTNISFVSDPVITEVVDGTATPLSTAFSAADISLLAPTAANASIEGTVTRSNGSGLSGATVVLGGVQSSRRSVLTNGFGRFRFDDVTVGETYTIDVRAKGLIFRSRLITVTEDVTGLEIGPEP